MTATVRPSHRVRTRTTDERAEQVDVRPDHLRLVDPNERPAGAHRRLFAALAVALLAGGVFGLVTFHVVLTQQQLRLDRLETRVAEQRARYDRQRLQVAGLESPERIVARAQERIGMVPAPEVVSLSPSGVRSEGPPADRPDPGTDAAPEDETEPIGAWPTVKAQLAGGAR